MLATHYSVGTRAVFVLALVGLAGVLRAEDKLPTIKNSVGMQLVLIPAGEFLMGSSPAEIEKLKAEKVPKQVLDVEQPQHRVRITRPFYLGQTEVFEP